MKVRKADAIAPRSTTPASVRCVQDGRTFFRILSKHCIFENNTIVEKMLVQPIAFGLNGCDTGAGIGMRTETSLCGSMVQSINSPGTHHFGLENTLPLTSKSKPGGRDDDGSVARPVVDRLRADITSSVYAPEAKLKFADLSKRYDVGIGTLREALSQLGSEGFVTLEVGKGFKVAPVSREELIEITSHFIDLEKRALAESIQHGDENWESNLVATHHRLTLIERLPWSERMERHSEWVERHRDFHKALVAACPGQWLFRLRSLMFDQLDRYRFLTKKAPEGLGSRKFAEHGQIKDAALAHEVDKAVALIEHHIRDTSERIISLL